jgi:hypothetical protein
MKKNHSTNDESFVSIPSPISSEGKVDIKKTRLPSLVTSKRFTISEIANEISQRHPENTFTSLLEWIEGMELALRLHHEGFFPYSKEKEVILVIFKLTPTTSSDLSVFRQIIKNDWLPRGIKAAAKEQFENLIGKK